MSYAYRQTKINGKKMLQHRAIMEKHLGRPLLTEEYIHHVNGEKKDNRIENLEVMNPVDHGREHHLRHPLVKTCEACGCEFVPHKTKRKRAKNCSIKCGWVSSSRKQKKKPLTGIAA